MKFDFKSKKFTMALIAIVALLTIGITVAIANPDALASSLDTLWLTLGGTITAYLGSQAVSDATKEKKQIEIDDNVDKDLG